jgi:hypothetical protein
LEKSAMTTALAPAPAPAKAPAGIKHSIPNKVRAAFAFLPEQATGAPKLADFFIEIGIQGRRNDKLLCPVASYLRAVTGFGNIRVGTLTTTVKTPNGSVTIQNPAAVVCFIVLFDRGGYKTRDGQDPLWAGW